MVASQPQFSPKEVAEALGASESSVKRWCDQGAIKAIRTVGGHRRITLDALADYLRRSGRQLIAPQALGVVRWPRSTDALPAADTKDHDAFRRALTSGDESTCRTLLKKKSRQLQSPTLAADFLVTDAMHAIGEAWDCDQADIYQERRACHICLRLIEHLKSSLPKPDTTSPVAIGGTPAGDPYQIPTALVELALSEAGWKATNLGSDLPIDSFLQAAIDQRPKLVWLSVSSIPDPHAFVLDQNRLAAELSRDISLLMGGRALTDQIRPKLQYTAHCDNLRQVLELGSALRSNPPDQS